MVRKRHYPSLPQTPAIVVRCALVIATTLLIGWTPLVDLVHQIQGGQRAAYLVMVVPLAMLIAYANRLRDIPANHKINDRQSDWLVAVPVAAVALIGAHIFDQSLCSYAELWRVDLLALVCWTGACLVLTFGIRPVTRHWRAWLFLLTCWPALHQVTAISLGNTAHTYAITNACYAAWCTWLAVVHTRARWVLALASAVLCLAAQEIVGMNHTVLAVVAGMCMPVLVTGVWILISLRRRGHPMRRSQPGHLAGIIAALLILATALWVHVLAGPVLAISGLPVFPAVATIDQTSAADIVGWRQQPNSTKTLSPRIFGPGTSATRSYLTQDDSTYGCWVDIVSARQDAALTLQPATVAYGLGGDSRRSVGTIPLGHGVNASLLYLDPSLQTSASAQPWIMVVWRVQLPGGHQQRISLVGYDTSVVGGDPATLPAMRPLSLTVIPQTIGYILRGQAQQAGNPPPVPLPMLDLAEQIVAQEFQ